MSFVGVALILLSALLLCRGWNKYKRTRLDSLLQLIDLVKYLESRIEGYLEPVDLALRRYGGHLPEELREGIAAGESLYEALKRVSWLGAYPGIGEELSHLFSQLGEGKVGRELRLIRGSIESLEREYSAVKDREERSRRVGVALIMAAAVGLCILLI